jgi:hypothetical protein
MWQVFMKFPTVFFKFPWDGCEMKQVGAGIGVGVGGLARRNRSETSGSALIVFHIF